MKKYSLSTHQKSMVSLLLSSFVRPMKIALSLALSAATLSCAPNGNLRMAFAPASSIQTIAQHAVDVDGIVEVDRGMGRDVIHDEAAPVEATTRQTPAAQAALSASMTNGGDSVVMRQSTPVANATGQVGASITYVPPAPDGEQGDDAPSGTLEPRFEWTSVDTYHADPPMYNALGRFEERWYAAHNFTAIGAGIASLEEGDLLLVDGVLLRVAWLYDGSYESSYSEVRSIVGLESTCFQTCTGVGTGIRVAVCYPA